MDHHSNQYLFYCIRLYIHAQLQQALAGNLGVGGGVSSCFMTVLEAFLCETRVAGGRFFGHLTLNLPVFNCKTWNESLEIQGGTILTNNMQNILSTFNIADVCPIILNVMNFSICWVGSWIWSSIGWRIERMAGTHLFFFNPFFRWQRLVGVVGLVGWSQKVPTQEVLWSYLQRVCRYAPCCNHHDMSKFL